MGSEGRNVSRPVEFSAARPLLADKAGRAKSPLQAPSPASAPHTRSQQPRALSPPIAAAALPSPLEKPVSGRPPEDSGDPRAWGKTKTKKDARLPPRGARGSTAGQRTRPGLAVRGEEAPWLSPPRPFRHRHPALASLHPQPLADKSLPSPAAQPAEPLGERAQSRSPRLTAGAGSPAQPPLTSAPARSPARGSHRSRINKSACKRGRRACHGEGSQQSPPLLHGGGESP